MKKLLALLIALIMVLSLAACGENTDNPSGDTDNPGVSQNGDNGDGKNDSETKYGFYLSDEVIEKMDSIEKGVENERLVVKYVYESYRYVEIKIHTWSDSNKAYDSIEIYRFFNNPDKCKQHITDYGADMNILEDHSADGWFKAEPKELNPQIGMETYSEMYNYYDHSAMNYEILE